MFEWNLKDICKKAICKSRNVESGKGMREMQGMGEKIQGIGVEMQEIWVGMRGIELK